MRTPPTVRSLALAQAPVACTRRATPNYSVDLPTIRQMALYDVVKQSTYDSFYAGYERGPRPSPPPNPMVRERYGLERGPLAPRTSTLAVRSLAHAILRLLAVRSASLVVLAASAAGM